MEEVKTDYFDIADFLPGVAKRFCPQCGEAVSQNARGRPRKFCSQECSRLWWKAHPKKNNGERDQYYIADHHDGIVTREEWDAAQERLEKIAGQRSKKKPKQQRLVPLRTGRLRGYIPIRPMWKTVSHTRLVNATEKLEERCKPGERKSGVRAQKHLK